MKYVGLQFREIVTGCCRAAAIRIKIFLLVTLVSASADAKLSPPFQVQPDGEVLTENRWAFQLANDSNELSLGEAIAIAKRRHPGEVLSARRTKDARGQTVYVIKMLSEKGVVKKVRIHAAR